MYLDELNKFIKGSHGRNLKTSHYLLDW